MDTPLLIVINQTIFVLNVHWLLVSLAKVSVNIDLLWRKIWSYHPVSPSVSKLTPSRGKEWKGTVDSFCSPASISIHRRLIFQLRNIWLFIHCYCACSLIILELIWFQTVLTECIDDVTECSQRFVNCGTFFQSWLTCIWTSPFTISHNTVQKKDSVSYALL